MLDLFQRRYTNDQQAHEKIHNRLVIGGNGIEITVRYHLMLTWNTVIIKVPAITRVGEEGDKLQLLCLADANVKCKTSFEKQPYNSSEC